MRERVETWKAIAAAVGRSQRWCRYMHSRTERPLPAFKLGGIACLYLDDLQRWIDGEQVKPGPVNHPKAVRAKSTRLAEARQRARAVIDAAVDLGELGRPEALGG